MGIVRLILAVLALFGGAYVGVTEIRWLHRTNLALLLIILSVSVCLLALATILERGQK